MWQFFDMTSLPNLFEVALFLLPSLVTGQGFMSISSLVLELWQFSFNKRLTRNPEIGNISTWVLPNLGRVRDTKFGVNVSNKMLLKAAKCQCYSFYRFWVIKEKSTGGLNLPIPPPLIPSPRLGFINFTQRKRKTYDSKDLSVPSLVSIIVYVYYLGKKFYYIYLNAKYSRRWCCFMQYLSTKKYVNSFLKYAKNEKTCEQFFNTFNRWYENKEKTQICCT